jgi:oligopeptide/dipeptide ABC transporter ATP-binding protein
VAHDGRMVVIYRGEVFEEGPVDQIIQAPVNPYTQSLLSAVPVLIGLEQPGAERFSPKEAMETALVEAGCLFRGRCPFATDKCGTEHPELLPIDSPGHLNRCFYPAARRVVATSSSEPGQPVRA